MSKSRSRSTIYTMFIIAMPILNQYRLLGMTFMDAFNIITFIVVLINEKGKIRVDTGFLPYSIYALLTMFSSMVQLPVYSFFLMFKNVLSFTLLMFNMFIVGKKYFDLETGYNFYGFVVKACCGITIVEFVVHLFTSYRIVLVVPMFSLNYGGGMSGFELIHLLKHTYGNYRASALFLEPAYLSEYCLPFLFLSLFYSDNRFETKNIVLALFTTLSIALTTSMLGILGCIIAWALYICKILWTSKRRKLIILVPVVFAAAYYMYSIEAVQNQFISKIYSAQNLTMSTSLSLRLTRGWYCYNALENLNKIMGVGYGCVSSFFTEHNITTIIDKEGIVNSYMNGASLMLCSLGIIGTVLYILPFLKMTLKNINNIYLLILWLVLMLTSQFFDTATYVIIFVFLANLSTRSKNHCISTENVSFFSPNKRARGALL